MSSLLKIKLLKDFEQYKAGDVVAIPWGIGRTMIDYGKGKEWLGTNNKQLKNYKEYLEYEKKQVKEAENKMIKPDKLINKDS